MTIIDKGEQKIQRKKDIKRALDAKVRADGLLACIKASTSL